jgi:hypothetical protein
MSMFSTAMACVSGRDGNFAKWALPQSPRSSPEKSAKMTVRAGRRGSAAKARANCSTATVPDPLSLAPLQMTSAPLGAQFWPPPLTPTWSMCALTRTYSWRSVASLPSRMPMVLGAVEVTTPCGDVMG